MRDDYAGDFDPDFEWTQLSRQALGRFGREIMLCAMMHDRGLLPQVGRRYGREAMTDVAVDEWMGSSPLYNERNRALLQIAGHDVGAIFKGLQLDIGAPHQFLDFHFELKNESLGYFWLPFCGAFSFVKEMAGDDEKPIFQLCHHMEDTTFNATVAAVHPRARCIPEHRPPQAPPHAGPVCRWRVEIGGEPTPLTERPILQAIRQSLAAGFEFGPIPEAHDGLSDYGGAFRPDFVLEDLSQPVLARQAKEFALDWHLLVRAAYTSIEERYGHAAMSEIARHHWAAVAPVYSARIRRALGIEGDDLGTILKMLQLDPCFPPEYVVSGCHWRDARTGHFWIEACAALEDILPRGILEPLFGGEAAALEAVVCAVNPRARVRAIDPADCYAAAGRAKLAFEIVLDPQAAAREEEPLAGLVRSNIIDFRFRGTDGPLD